MRFKILSAALLLGVAGAASAGSNPGTMQVSAEPVNTCYIQGATLDFGQIPAVVNTPIDAVGNIDVQCSPLISWTITADDGANGSILHDPGQRHMEANGEYLSYYLYTDSTRAVPLYGFDELTGASGAEGGVQQVPVYASITAGQIVTANVFGDQVGLTINFN